MEQLYLLKVNEEVLASEPAHLQEVAAIIREHVFPTDLLVNFSRNKLGDPNLAKQVKYKNRRFRYVAEGHQSIVLKHPKLPKVVVKVPVLRESYDESKYTGGLSPVDFSHYTHTSALLGLPIVQSYMDNNRDFQVQAKVRSKRHTGPSVQNAYDLADFGYPDFGRYNWSIERHPRLFDLAFVLDEVKEEKIDEILQTARKSQVLFPESTLVQILEEKLIGTGG